MTKSLREILLYACVLPVVVGGLMFWLGAGVFSFLAALLTNFIASKIVAARKARDAALNPCSRPEPKIKLSDSDVFQARIFILFCSAGGLLMAVVRGAGSNSVFGMIAGMGMALFLLFTYYYKRAIKIEAAQP